MDIGCPTKLILGKLKSQIVISRIKSKISHFSWVCETDLFSQMMNYQLGHCSGAHPRPIPQNYLHLLWSHRRPSEKMGTWEKSFLYDMNQVSKRACRNKVLNKASPVSRYTIKGLDRRFNSVTLFQPHRSYLWGFFVVYTTDCFRYGRHIWPTPLSTRPTSSWKAATVRGSGLMPRMIFWPSAIACLPVMTAAIIGKMCNGPYVLPLA